MTCHFQKSWLKNAKYADWLTEVPEDSTVANCKLCLKSQPIQLKKMGVSALGPYAKSKVVHLIV